MLELESSYRRFLDLPADFVFSLIADFEHHHVNFMPPNITNYKVLAGGYGEGTEISCFLSVGSWRQELFLRISEPIPGRVLVLSGSAIRSLTVYRVRDEHHGCSVEHALNSRIAGNHSWLDEHFWLPLHRRRFQRQSLINLEQYAHTVWKQQQGQH